MLRHSVLFKAFSKSGAKLRFIIWYLHTFFDNNFASSFRLLVCWLRNYLANKPKKATRAHAGNSIFPEK